MKELEHGSMEEETICGFSRRDFLKFCSTIAVGMGLPLGAGVEIAEAVTTQKRPPVLWLSAQECTGCTETLLRTNHPTLDKLILELISLEYHETLLVGAGKQAEQWREKINEGIQRKVHPRC